MLAVLISAYSFSLLLGHKSEGIAEADTFLRFALHQYHLVDLSLKYCSGCHCNDAGRSCHGT